MTDLLKPEAVSVRTEGTLVVLTIGGTDIKMPYDNAIQLSTWLRVNGKKAKTLAGDNSRHWSVVGNLTALDHGERPLVQSRL